METDESAKLTVKAVAERTGVPVHTLRAWERRYRVPLPQRGADNRYRLYGEQDIADVLFLKHQVESGITPSQASLMLRQRRTEPVSSPTTPPGQPVDSIRAKLLEAFAISDERAARQVLDESFALLTPEQVALQIIEPALKEVGERWMRNEMTVWQEHLASNVIQQKLFSILQAQPSPPPSAPLLAAACAPGEEHQVGLIILALFARRQGWRVAYLGQDTPLADLVDLADTSKPNAIVVSVTTVIGLAHVIPWLEKEKRPNAPLGFGGRMPNLSSTLRDHLPGAYLGENALEAVRGLGLLQKREPRWIPSQPVLDLVALLEAQRPAIAGDVVAEFKTVTPTMRRGWDAIDVNYATLFLIDSLACALAFGAPDIMDLQHQWLQVSMPPRSVGQPLIVKHLDIVAAVLSKQFAKGQMRFFTPLLERLRGNG